jgi:hypothetical protein
MVGWLIGHFSYQMHHTIHREGPLAWHDRSTRKVSYINIAMIHPERDARNYAARRTGKNTPNKKNPNENMLLLPITEANNKLGSLLPRGYNELVADVRIS